MVGMASALISKTIMPCTEVTEELSICTQDIRGMSIYHTPSILHLKLASLHLMLCLHCIFYGTLLWTCCRSSFFIFLCGINTFLRVACFLFFAKYVAVVHLFIVVLFSTSLSALNANSRPHPSRLEDVSLWSNPTNQASPTLLDWAAIVSNHIMDGLQASGMMETLI